MIKMPKIKIDKKTLKKIGELMIGLATFLFAIAISTLPIPIAPEILALIGFILYIIGFVLTGLI
jgi:multidrug transporter EmrE-like cation transporter